MKDLHTAEAFMKFYMAETIQKLNELLEKYEMTNEEDWVVYGKNPQINITGNHSIIGNQSSSSDKALSEKIINAIDAVLMSLCMELGINPRSQDAPKTAKELIERYFGIPEGNIDNATKEQMEKLYNYINIIATSEDGKTVQQFGRNKACVNLTILDVGEGQSPVKLPLTILSLILGNKKGIAIAQGKYNQGGSGYLKYCEEGYSLVISRRNPAIPQEFNDPNDDSIDDWGWTLIKLVYDPETNDPIYKYYAPNGKVLRFSASALKLKPKKLNREESRKYSNGNDCTCAKPYEVDMTYGTAIKLYNYELKQKGCLTSHAKYTLGRCILETNLPIRAIDCRRHNFNNISDFRGMSKTLNDALKVTDPNEKLINNKFPVYGDFMVGSQKVTITAYGFNQRPKDKLNADMFTEGDSAIRLVLGQQFQGTIDKSIISNCGLSSIKDYLLIMLQFPDIDQRFKSKLFLTDRERLDRDSEEYKELFKKLKSFISTNEVLKEFAYERTAKLTEINDNDPGVKELMEKWINENPDIKDILGSGEFFSDDIGSSDGNGVHGKKTRDRNRKQNGGTKKDPVTINYLPTYFTPRHRKNNQDQFEITCTKGKSFAIRFKTDAPEDFWIRNKNTGRVSVKLKNIDITNDIVKSSPKDGVSEFCFYDKFSKKLGVFKIEIEVTCDDTDIKFVNSIFINVVNVEKENGGEKKEKSLKLPEHKMVSEEDWGLVNMDKYSGVRLVDGIYYINMDNCYYKNKLQSINNEGEKSLYKKFYLYSMLFNAMATHQFYQAYNSNSDISKLEEMVIFASDGFARTLFISDQLAVSIRQQIYGITA